MRARTRPAGLRLAAACAIVVGVALTACADDETDTGDRADKPAASQGYPVTIRNCGRTLTFDKAPSRAVLPYHPIAEIFVGLGLAHRAIGRVAFTGAQGGLTDPPTLPEQAAAFEAIRVVSKTIFPPPKEQMLTLRPDVLLAYGEFDYGGKHAGAEGLATYGQLKQAGAEVYTVVCPDRAGKFTGERLAATYRTILDLGKIFGVSERARRRVAEMKAQIAVVKRKVAREPRVAVVVYGGGKGPLQLLGGGINNELVENAGGRNVFADEDPYFEASRESVAATNAKAFVIFADPTEQQPGRDAARFLFKTFANLPASRSRRYALTSYAYTNPSWRNAQTVEDIARQLHPRAFDERSETHQFTDR